MIQDLLSKAIVFDFGKVTLVKRSHKNNTWAIVHKFDKKVWSKKRQFVSEPEKIDDLFKQDCHFVFEDAIDILESMRGVWFD